MSLLRGNVVFWGVTFQNGAGGVVGRIVLENLVLTLLKVIVDVI